MQFDVGPELGARYGLDPELCAGAQFGDRPWQRAPYFVRSPGPKPPVTLATLRIKSWHNFGNMLQQMLHALTFAERNGVPTISGPASPWWRGGEVGGVRMSFAEPFRRPALVGHFFYPQPLGLAEPLRQSRHLRLLRALFTVKAAEASDEMVVHLRSGDVFGRDPHPDYWPPALGYYTSAIDHAGARGVRLVCQDWEHPLLGPLVEWCRQRGVDCSVQVSDDLRTDLAILTGARTLCISQGTLGLSAAWMSPRLERVYLPRGTHVGELRGLGVEVIEAVPPTPLGPWQASPEQVAGLVQGADPVPLQIVS